jgi:hypothetical protein
VSDGFGATLLAEEFLERCEVYHTTQGSTVHVLSPEDELLHLSIHAAGHRFLRLLWLYDIKLLLRKHPDLNWRSVAARAKRLRVLAAFLFTCEMLQNRLGVEIPHFADTLIRRGRSRTARFLLSTIARQPESSRRSLAGQIAFATVLCDGPQSAITYLNRQMLLIVRRRVRRHFPRLVPEEWAY